MASTGDSIASIAPHQTSIRLREPNAGSPSLEQGGTPVRPSDETNPADCEAILEFDDADDAANPLNWSKKRKWLIVMLLSVMSTINTTATLTCTPAVPQILAYFDSTDESLSTFVVSVWELGEGVGPLVIAPLAEHFGRLPVWHTCNTLFALCSIACALSNSIGMLIAFRFLNGLVVASITLGPTIVSDLFKPEERALAISIAAMTPMLGPTFGPTIGSFLTQSLGWRWVFWVIAIAVAVFEVPSFAILKETYKVQILRRRARATKDLEKGAVGLLQRHQSPRQGFSLHIFLRTVSIWVFYPVVFVLALYLATAYGYQYLVFTTFTGILEQQYSFPDAEVGFAFIGIGIGSVLGMVAVGLVSDWYVKRQKLARGDHRPEDRLPPIIAGTLIMAAGLFLYGWTAQYRIQWMAPILGTAIQGFGLAVILISTETYLVDAFPVYAASASAAGSMLRSLAGAFIPFAGPPLYRALGIAWGNALLGFCALAFLPVPLLLMRSGERGRVSWNSMAKL